MNNVSLHTYNPAFIKFIENIALCNFNELTIYSKNKKGNHFDLLNINFKKNSKFDEKKKYPCDSCSSKYDSIFPVLRAF